MTCADVEGETTPTLVENFDEATELHSSAPFAYTKTAAAPIIPIKYTWTITIEQGRKTVTEHAFIPWTWFLGLVTGFFTLLTVLGLYHESTGFAAVILGLAAVLLLLGVVSWFILYLGQTSPQASLLTTGTNHRTYLPFASIIIPLPFLIAVYLFLDGVPRLLAGIALIGCLSGYIVAHGPVVRWSLKWQRIFIDEMKQVPLVAGNYIAAALLSIIPWLVFLIITTTELTRYLFRSVPYVTAATFSVVFLAMWVILIQSLRDAHTTETEQFRREGRTVGSKAAFVTAVVTFAATAIFVWVNYMVIQTAIQFVILYETLPVAVFALVLLFPTGYLIIGILYQYYSIGTTFSWLLRHADPIDSDCPYTVYQIDYDGYVAGAIDIGIWQSVYISSGLIDLLTEKERDALIAHEQAHIDHSDALLSVLIAIFSPLVLIGKNVFYSVLDFRQRELRADDEAAEKTTSQDLLSALDKVMIANVDQQVRSPRIVVPTFTSFNSTDYAATFRSPFDFYFGDFALTDVHPPLAERCQRLRKQLNETQDANSQ